MNTPVDTPVADVSAWGWQGSTKAIKDRTAYMLDYSPIPFNVMFEVYRPGKEAVTVEAHKDILAMGSEVFLAMFYGGLTDNEKFIHIPDTDPKAFSIMIRFLYTEKLSTALMKNDIRVAFEVMKCAGKYGVPHLYIQSRQWILEHFAEHFDSGKNVETDALSYLRLALKVEFEDHKILEAMWNVIDVCTESVLQTPDEVLRHVRLDLLTVFLARDSLTVLKEKQLYDFMNRWAKLQASSESDVTQLSLRERLGDTIRNIRYTEMDPSEISNGPAADNVLTLEETAQVYQHQFAPVVEGTFPFISGPREGTEPPTMLTIKTGFLPDKSRSPSFCASELLADLTIEVAELDDELMSLVRKLHAPRSKDISTTSWSFIENSVLTTFQVQFVYSSLADYQEQVLKDSAAKEVRLGFGEVAMEVTYSRTVMGANCHYYSVDSLSLIIGGYTNSLYASTPTSEATSWLSSSLRATISKSVFYLGRIVRGTTDLSFLRHFLKPGSFFPTSHRMRISTKFSEKEDEDDYDEEAQSDDDEEEEWP